MEVKTPKAMRSARTAVTLDVGHVDAVVDITPRDVVTIIDIIAVVICAAIVVVVVDDGSMVTFIPAINWVKSGADVNDDMAVVRAGVETAELVGQAGFVYVLMSDPIMACHTQTKHRITMEPRMYLSSKQ